jgi:hypothetical protein
VNVKQSGNAKRKSAGNESKNAVSARGRAAKKGR